ncbi:unnamed protein product [Prorocentrum cordatum]|uniref:Uncharacterized protein n=1 Tax=Prorocentrum cordatum TaxID=2364126 RepID=A0ABN9WHF5_9DINO|nr:unnamed protein product [Polarella glacialis]
MSAGFLAHGCAALEGASLPRPGRGKALPPVEDDDDTTDAGSDLETVCTSTSAQASESEDVRPQAHGRLLLSARARAPRFRSALATIPGTPVSRPPASRPLGTWTAAAPGRVAAPPPGHARCRPSPPGLLSTGGSAATAAPVLATQAPQPSPLAPQRVRLPRGAGPPPGPLDPEPASVDRSMPLKKRVTDFLIQDARCVLAAPLLG